MGRGREPQSGQQGPSPFRSRMHVSATRSRPDPRLSAALGCRPDGSATEGKGFTVTASPLHVCAALSVLGVGDALALLERGEKALAGNTLAECRGSLRRFLADNGLAALDGRRDWLIDSALSSAIATPTLLSFAAQHPLERYPGEDWLDALVLYAKRGPGAVRCPDGSTVLHWQAALRGELTCSARLKPGDSRGRSGGRGA